MTEIKNKTSIMDLYAMMGLTINSPLIEVRKAYRNMARICHPDRGGNPSDMHILKNAYDYIVYQLEHVSLENDKGSYEEREMEYEEFIKKQSETKMPSLNDIEIEALGINSEFINKIKENIKTSIPKEYLDDFMFNMIYREIMCKIQIYSMRVDADISNYNEIETIVNTFLNSYNYNLKTKINETFHSSIPGGYGELMDTSPEPLEVPLKPEFNFGCKSLLIYKTQQSCALISSKHKQNDHYANIPIPEKLEDYSQGTMCDYKAAHSSTIEESNKLLADYENKNNKERTIESLINERNELDMRLLNTSKKEKISLLSN
jgi:hypothetical protein